MELIAQLKMVEVGDEIELLSSDKGSAADVPQWINKVGHELVGTREELRRRVQDHIGRLPVSYYDSNKSGMLVSRQLGAGTRQCAGRRMGWQRAMGASLVTAAGSQAAKEIPPRRLSPPGPAPPTQSPLTAARGPPYVSTVRLIKPTG